MCNNYDDPCDRCLGEGIPGEDDCFICNNTECICDEITDRWLEERDN